MLQYVHQWVGTDKSLSLCVAEGLGPCRMVPESQQQVGGDLVKAHKLPNPIMASQQHRALHQELLLCYRWWVNMQLCSGSKGKVHLMHLRICSYVTLRRVSLCSLLRLMSKPMKTNVLLTKEDTKVSVISLTRGQGKKIHFIARRQQWIITCFSFSSVSLTNIYFAQTSGERVWHWPRPEPSRAMHFLVSSSGHKQQYQI